MASSALVSAGPNLPRFKSTSASDLSEWEMCPLLPSVVHRRKPLMRSSVDSFQWHIERFIIPELMAATASSSLSPLRYADAVASVKYRCARPMSPRLQVVLPRNRVHHPSSAQSGSLRSCSRRSSKIDLASSKCIERHSARALRIHAWCSIDLGSREESALLASRTGSRRLEAAPISPMKISASALSSVLWIRSTGERVRRSMALQSSSTSRYSPSAMSSEPKPSVVTGDGSCAASGRGCLRSASIAWTWSTARFNERSPCTTASKW